MQNEQTNLYEQEADNLTNHFRPGQGKYKITFLGELGPVKDVTWPDGSKGHQRDVKISVLNLRNAMNNPNEELKLFEWSLSKSNGKQSLYGQVILFGKLNKQLNGKTCTLMVQGEGQQKRYTIEELLI